MALFSGETKIAALRSASPPAVKRQLREADDARHSDTPISANYDLQRRCCPRPAHHPQHRRMKFGRHAADCQRNCEYRDHSCEARSQPEGQRRFHCGGDQLAAASGIAFAPGVTVTGTVNADVQARGPADQPALSGTIPVPRPAGQRQTVPQPVQVKSSESDLHAYGSSLG